MEQKTTTKSREGRQQCAHVSLLFNNCQSQAQPGPCLLNALNSGKRQQTIKQLSVLKLDNSHSSKPNENSLARLVGWSAGKLILAIKATNNNTLTNVVDQL
ncbi:conserved hypothetical protein [Trichinella spiralis]|uniref:hypothetical protein n=1 Tax=Trichinella spiralis TaxID=6334 RepID=UPI0001EFC25E|nr:conserved hypothetical protein [Trichinella spiralis]